MTTFVQETLDSGGSISPLIIANEASNSTGLMNPSVFVDKDGDILVNLRHVNYTLYHSEGNQRFTSRWGPLAYLHPETDQRLATTNYLCKLDKNLEVEKSTVVDTSLLDVEPLWEFVGLEDARLVYWEDKYYLIGVRRDTTTSGQGRMEFSEIELDKENWTAKEVSRHRIPAPLNGNSYCEKNWVPVLDMPFHLVKWTAPTELVQAYLENPPRCEQLFVREGVSAPADQRGGSQIFRWGNYRVSITHEVYLFNNYLGRKDGIYRHRFCVWDDQWNLVGISPGPITFLDARVEFCAGAAVFGENLLVTFGFQDNAAYILDVPKQLVDKYVLEALSNVQ
jgi:hypothetical protein